MLLFLFLFSSLEFGGGLQRGSEQRERGRRKAGQPHPTCAAGLEPEAGSSSGWECRWGGAPARMAMLAGSLPAGTQHLEDSFSQQGAGRPWACGDLGEGQADATVPAAEQLLGTGEGASACQVTDICRDSLPSQRVAWSAASGPCGCHSVGPLRVTLHCHLAWASALLLPFSLVPSSQDSHRKWRKCASDSEATPPWSALWLPPCGPLHWACQPFGACWCWWHSLP